MIKLSKIKVLSSKGLSPFGGLNFVLKELDRAGLGSVLNQQLPALGHQSQYQWRDLFYSYWSVFFCGGNCAEDLSGNFRGSLSSIPFLKIPSPDRVLNRIKELALPPSFFNTDRGKAPHHFAVNDPLAQLNLKITNKLFKLSNSKVIVDYDNTLCFHNKKDAKRTYLMDKGYAPGVGFVGSKIIYVENRNGNNNASTLQDKTLERMFQHLEKQNIKVGKFRADSASYTHKAIQVIDSNCDTFYVKARQNQSMAEALGTIKQWKEIRIGSALFYRAEVSYAPFKRTVNRSSSSSSVKPYRLIVTKTQRRDGQINFFTKEASSYSIIVTNDWESTQDEVVFFYNKRGAIEREFDVLKNDFGWKNLPFSNLEQNLVYLQIMALCRNIYHYIISLFSQQFKGLQPTFRIKKFIFRFVCIPAKWIYHARQWHLKIYGNIAYKT